MNPDNDRQYVKLKKSVIIVALLVLAAGVAGWLLGRPGKPANNTQSGTSNQAAPTRAADAGSAPGVASLVRYALPDGWKESTCPAAPGSVYITPAGADDADCSANPSAPVKLSVDPGNNKDCNDLQGVSEVKKHVCISLYINGKKSLKATTEYLSSSDYKKDMTVDAYYIDTGKGVVKAEYFHSTDNSHQSGFDELANSIQAKN